MITSREGCTATPSNRGADPAPESDEDTGIPLQRECAERRSGQESIRVFLVIDTKLVRGALTVLLSREDDIEVVAGMASSDRVVPTIARYRPDVAVLDVDLGGPDVLAVAKALNERLPECRVIVLVTARRPGLVVRTLDIPLAGAVDTNAQPRRLLHTIRQVAKGRKVIDPALAVVAIGAAGNPLTPRELAVLDLAAGGSSPAEIAQRLFLTRGTVGNYLSRIIMKLGARSRIDAIRIARDAGWI